jgi:Fe-S oxidoreductase
MLPPSFFISQGVWLASAPAATVTEGSPLARAIAMTVMLLLSLSVFAVLMRKRLLILLKMRHDPALFQDLGERTKRLLRFGIGQGRMVDKGEESAGIAHILIFSAFVVLALRTVTLFAMAYGGFNFHFPLLGPDYITGKLYLFLKDIVVLGALAGTSYFLYLRLFKKPARMSESFEGVLILLFIQGLMITEIFFEAGMVIAGTLKDIHPSILHPALSLGVGALKLLGFEGQSAYQIGVAGYWVHCSILLIFLNFLPIGKHFHVITGLFTVFLQRVRPTGQIPAVGVDFEEADEKDLERVGISNATQLTWKMALDTYSCTECGRCLTHCPTYITDKPLSHKGLNLTIREHLMRSADLLLAEKTEALPAMSPDVISQETIWSCTTCGWCESACPVFIEQIPRIIDMRRSDVLVRAEFPEEAVNVFRGMETQGNPWGVNAMERDKWTEETDLKIPTVEENPEFEYLWYVGCAGAYDDRQKKVSIALAKILDAAGVNYAILGKKETCNGDTARRLGNEMLFQMLAKANIEQFEQHKVRKVFTHCPHCFNVIKNEYTQFNVSYETYHHSELIAQLLKDKRIQPNGAFNELVTYHDSCYMGRYNQVYDEPRDVLSSIPGLQLKDMERSRKQSFCCGAGGGRMWLEEHTGERINHNRVKEIVETGAKTVATNCPFCLTMIRDGLNDLGAEDIRARDIAELVADSLSPASK